MSFSWVWIESDVRRDQRRTRIDVCRSSLFLLQGFSRLQFLYMYICISISSNNNKNKKYTCFHHGTTCHSVGRLVGWGTIESNRIDYPSQVKSKWMHRNEKIHACFAFLYLLYYMFPFLVSPSFFLSLFIFSYLCLLYIMERNSYDVCVLYAVIQFHNRYFVHRFNDSFLLLPLSIKCVFILLSFASVLNCKINTP